MAKEIKKENIVPSEVVKVETPPPAPVVQTTTAPAPKSGGGNSALKVGLGICLGCLILIIIVVVGIFVTGGLAIKNIGIPFLKKAVNEVKKEGTLEKIQEGKKLLEQIPTQGITQGGLPGGFKEETKIPDTFPKDFPLYPGAKVVKAVSTEALVKAGFLISLETLDSSQTVVSYYQTNLPKSGWPISGSFGGIISAKKGDQTAVVTIAAKETAKTEINIVLGSK